MRTDDLPEYAGKKLSYYAYKLLKDLHFKSRYLKPMSDDKDYIERNFITNKEFWKAAAELIQRNLADVSSLDTFVKFYHMHVHFYTMSWKEGEYEDLRIQPTIKGAWQACFQETS